MHMEKAEYGKNTNDNETNFAPALQSPQIPRPPTKADPPLGTSGATTAPLQLNSAVTAIACRIKCPVSAALSYGKGRNGR